MTLNESAKLTYRGVWRGNGPPAANRRGKWALRSLSRSLAGCAV